MIATPIILSEPTFEESFAKSTEQGAATTCVTSSASIMPTDESPSVEP